MNLKEKFGLFVFAAYMFITVTPFPECTWALTGILSYFGIVYDNPGLSGGVMAWALSNGSFEESWRSTLMIVSGWLRKIKIKWKVLRK